MSHAVSKGAEEFLHSLWPELDEIPGNVLERLSKTQLAQIGRKTLGNLGTEARRRVQAGYTDAQIGTFAVIAFLQRGKRKG